MGTTRKTITVTDQQDNWIKAQIAAGEFTNDSEYIRDLIRATKPARPTWKQSAPRSLRANKAEIPSRLMVICLNRK